MLKQPDRIVIYPQRDSKPGYLLCWIPPREYDYVSGGSESVEAELLEYFPNGIETEFSLEGFEEFEISLPFDLDVITQAYIDLDKAGLFSEVEFLELKRLVAFVEDMDDVDIQELLANFSAGDITLDDLKKNPSFKKLLTAPKSKGGEDPGEAFQKLSGQLDSPKE